jgi:tetratricopeptide (TPR) repeat protein
MKFAAAEASLREALGHSQKINGDAHRETLLTRLKLANLLILTGRADEGLALQAAVRATMARGLLPYDGALDRDSRFFLTATSLMRGRPQESAGILEADVESLRTSLPRSNMRSASELALAEVWLAAGRVTEARAMLEEATANRRAALGGEENVRAWLPNLRVRAHLARAEGDPSKSLAILAVVPEQALHWADVEAIAIAIERARALRAAARAAEAVEIAQRALAALQALPRSHPLPYHEASAWEAIAEAQLAAGRRDEARAAYARAVALRRARDAQGSIWLAQDQRALAALGHAQATRVVTR